MRRSVVDPSKESARQGPVLAVHHDPEEGARKNAVPWFSVGTRKLWVLSVLTLCAYTFYWFERQYRHQKLARRESTWPTWRALFSVFYAPNLFRRIDAAATGVDLEPGWSPRWMAVVYCASWAISWVLDEGSGYLEGNAGSVVASVALALAFCSIYPLVRVQATVNQVLEREGKLVHPNERFTPWNWLVAVFGGVMLVLLVYVIWFPPELEMPDLGGSAPELWQ